MVDEDAGELVADGALDQGGGHGRVDAAGQPADHPVAAHLGPDGSDLLVDDARGGPRRPAAGDVVQEPLEHRLAVAGVQHLGVELDPGGPRPRSSNAATGAPADVAVTTNPAGAADTESPCDIQTEPVVGSPSKTRTCPP